MESVMCIYGVVVGIITVHFRGEGRTCMGVGGKWNGNNGV